MTICIVFCALSVALFSSNATGHKVLPKSLQYVSGHEVNPPLPTPCIPTSVSVTFSSLHTNACPRGREGILLTLKADDGCFFFTFDIRICRKRNRARVEKKITSCAQTNVPACSGPGFSGCITGAVEHCVLGRGEIVGISAIA